jgi:hypothetical protein
VPIGGQRLLGTSTKWGDINTAPGVYNWQTLDRWLSYSKPHNVDIIFTFLGVPAWAATDPQLPCSHWSGSCSPPSDLNADGTGTNKFFKDFVTAIAQHVGTQVGYWEIWNEPNIVSGGSGSNAYGSWNGTNAQLVRMAQDARSIILAINPNAKFLTPAPNPGAGNGVTNFMDGYLAAGGGNYADIIAFHGYVGTVPEDVIPLITGLKATVAKYAQSNKPIWDTEASWGAKTNFPDPEQRAAFVSRFYLEQWANGVSRFFWFGWDYLNTGTLWEATSNNGCITPSPSGGFLCPSGEAYGQITQWMVGATMTTPCSATGTVWTCGLSRPGGYQALVVWDTAQTCNNGSCTTSNFPVPASYKTRVDLDGIRGVILGASIAVGAKPLLLENQ